MKHSEEASKGLNSENLANKVDSTESVQHSVTKRSTLE